MVGEITARLHEQGADLVGTSHLGTLLPERFLRMPYAVTIGVRLSDAVISEIKGGPTMLYFAHYRTANAYLDALAFKCMGWLQQRGFNALAVPASQSTSDDGYAGDFSHKTAANMAGLGFIGKSALFVSSAFGPRVRLATVLTDAVLPSGDLQPILCDDCRACVDACPCGALAGRLWTSTGVRDELVDAALCSRHMKKAYQHIGRGAVCGICMAVCPMGKQAKNAFKLV